MKAVRTILALGLIALGLAVAACGSTTHSAAYNQNVTKAQAVVKKCLTNPLALRTSAGRQAFMNCAVPKKNRVKFNRCVEDTVLTGIPTKGRIERGVEKCIGRYA